MEIGTSAEGTLEGTPNQMTAYNGVLKLPEAELMLHYDNWGSDKTYPHMSVAWSWAFDTPFMWTKQVASHFGGTRQGMATEAALALVSLAFTRLRAERVEITNDARNLPSRRVAEKCGFALEGIQRRSRRDNAGALADWCIYARTA